MSVNLRIPFLNLHLIMEVEFLVPLNDFPILLCMRYMIKNNLDLSIRDICLKFEKKSNR